MNKKMRKNRKMRNILFAGTGTVILIMLVLSIGKNKKENSTEAVVFPVEVEVVKRSQRTRHLGYFGIISSSVMNYSFALSGKVETIFVNKNQKVTKGTKLMQLETSGLELALSASQNQLKQAEIAFHESDKYYQNLKVAFQSGGISEADLNKAKLDKDVKEQDFLQAKIDLEAQQENLEHATLLAVSDGIVSEIKPQKGEIIEAGAETIIVQGAGNYAETSVSQKDLDEIRIGAIAIVEYKDKKYKGRVSYISSLPDFQTFRHTVKIEFDKTLSNLTANIGQTVKIYIETGTMSGVWIPIKYVFNDGGNYVNVAENGRLRKKIVQIIDYSEDKVRIEGLTENDLLIIKGAGNISEGFKVKITNQ
jgi:HlyD family secretion protein